MDVFAIYARAANGAIGKAGRLPWHLPADLKRFKALTLGKPIIMGRKTFESLPGLLPDRRHIVLTRRESWQGEGTEIARSVSEALAIAARDNDAGQVAVIGGAAIFDVFLPYCARAEVTQIHADFDGDVFMPPLGAEWEVAGREDFGAEGKTPAYSFLTYCKTEETS